MLGAGIWFENALMQIVLRHLLEIDVTDPMHRYLLIEIADECRHSAMFGEYIRRAGTPSYGPDRPVLVDGSTCGRALGVPARAGGRGAARPHQPPRPCATTASTRCPARSPSSTSSRRPATSASPRRTWPSSGRPSTTPIARPWSTAAPELVAEIVALTPRPRRVRAPRHRRRGGDRSGQPAPPGQRRRRARQAHVVPRRARRHHRSSRRWSELGLVDAA